MGPPSRPGSRDGLGAKQVSLTRSECFSGVGGEGPFCHAVPVSSGRQWLASDPALPRAADSIKQEPGIKNKRLQRKRSPARPAELVSRLKVSRPAEC